MSHLIDLTGMRFGMLYVVKRVENAASNNSRYNETQWKCKCDCGNELIVKRSALLSKGKNNCGCIKKPVPIKHGLSNTKIHQKWLSMKDRCYCKNDSEYKNYGGRGITVCDEWLGKHGAENFIKWAIENGWSDEKDSKDLTIDRIDNNGNYCPENCRLVGRDVQENNKCNTIYITYKGETLPFSQMCEKYNVNYHTSYNRYALGYSAEEIFDIQKHKKSGARRKIAKIEPKTYKVIFIYNSAIEAAKENGFNSSNSILRVCSGKRRSAGGYIWKYYDDII